jgi:hypothetical protein
LVILIVLLEEAAFDTEISCTRQENARLRLALQCCGLWHKFGTVVAAALWEGGGGIHRNQATVITGLIPVNGKEGKA